MKKLFLLLIFVGGLFLIIKSNTSWLVFGQSKSSAEVTSNTEKIELHVSGASTTIFPEETDEVRADIKGNGKINVDTKGDTIIVESESKSWFNVFSLFNKREITIYIPNDFKQELVIDSGSGNIQFDGKSKMNLEELIVDISSGNVKISQLTAKNFELDGSSGNVTITSLGTESSTFDMSSGNLTIKNHIGKVKADLSSGKIDLQMDKVTDSLDLELNSGFGSIDLPKGADFTLHGEAGSGFISSDLTLMDLEKNKNNIYGISGSGKHEVKIKVSSGKVDIK
ncbi:MAG TPA: DUF4097 family beta strand repeat-containing protein [Metabacillus sp.]|nr:DUF4097 family beta strand repeat-containing protein [Metabacillus sp.]